MVSDRSTNNLPYRGRFAPSPTGPLHFGSLVSAVGSYLQARAQQGRWLVRMEDLDPPREQPGAADDILRTLEKFGLHWDGEVMYQSTRHAVYEDILDHLKQQQLAYPCGCSRKDISAYFGGSDSKRVYPGICRDGLPQGRQARSLRVKTRSLPIGFDDRVQGHYEQNVHEEVGDFVLKRADGFYAYQLAVVIDDAWQGITEVVRGSDLLDNTPRQIWLQRILKIPRPDYAHLPVAARNGAKLSKQTHAPPVSHRPPVPILIEALEFLGQQPPAELLQCHLDDLWIWAQSHWDLHKVPKIDAIEYCVEN